MIWNLFAKQWRRVIDLLKSTYAVSYTALSGAWIAKTQMKDHYPARRSPS